MLKSSIILPAYNSENTIEKLINEILDVFKDCEIEIVIVNDASKDATEKICYELYKQNQGKLIFISLMKNSGEHNAVMAGLRHATGDKIFIIDDDFQNPPSELKKLYEFTLQNNYDVVYTKYDSKRHSLFRNLSSKFVNICANFILNKPNNIYLSSFKSINRSVVDKIIEYEGYGTYIDGLIFQITTNVGQITVEHTARKEGKSGYTFTKLLSLFNNFLFNFSLLPLRLLTTSGFFIIIFSIFISLQVIVEKFNNPAVPPGYSITVLIIIFFSGLNLFFLGIIGEYIGRILRMVNKKPQYSVRKILKKTN